MSLQADILNIPCKVQQECYEGADADNCYRYGHRDARHAAAELANAADAKLEELRLFLEGWMHDGSLQTFESREKFRKECAATLDSLA